MLTNKSSRVHTHLMGHEQFTMLASCCNIHSQLQQYKNYTNWLAQPQLQSNFVLDIVKTLRVFNETTFSLSRSHSCSTATSFLPFPSHSCRCSRSHSQHVPVTVPILSCSRKFYMPIHFLQTNKNSNCNCNAIHVINIW